MCGFCCLFFLYATSTTEIYTYCHTLSRPDARPSSVEPRGLAAALARIGPGELLVPEKLLAAEPLFELWAEWKAQLTPLPNARFDSENARRRLEALYGVASLDGFAVFGRAELAAAGALVDYVELTQVGRLPHRSEE